MKSIYLNFLVLFFIFNVNASTSFEKISNDFELIYNNWNNGNFDKYEDIFRRDKYLNHEDLRHKNYRRMSAFERRLYVIFHLTILPMPYYSPINSLSLA